MNTDYELISTKRHENLASGNKYSAHVNVAGRHNTGFGKTEQEAIDNAVARAKGFKVFTR